MDIGISLRTGGYWKLKWGYGISFVEMGLLSHARENVAVSINICPYPNSVYHSVTYIVTWDVEFENEILRLITLFNS